MKVIEFVFPEGLLALIDNVITFNEVRLVGMDTQSAAKKVIFHLAKYWPNNDYDIWEYLDSEGCQASYAVNEGWEAIECEMCRSDLTVTGGLVQVGIMRVCKGCIQFAAESVRVP